ncbi:MAG: hypothetical protein ACPHJ3_06625 [Rubripirellula sp.]
MSYRSHALCERFRIMMMETAEPLSPEQAIDEARREGYYPEKETVDHVLAHLSRARCEVLGECIANEYETPDSDRTDTDGTPITTRQRQIERWQKRQIERWQKTFAIDSEYFESEKLVRHADKIRQLKDADVSPYVIHGRYFMGGMWQEVEYSFDDRRSAVDAWYALECDHHHLEIDFMDNVGGHQIPSPIRR